MIKDTIQNFRRKLQGRSIAYHRVFDPANQFTRDVLLDLAKFCRAHDSTFHPDARVAAALEGRREVWLRIQEYLQLNIEQIYELHRIMETKGEKNERG